MSFLLPSSPFAVEKEVILLSSPAQPSLPLSPFLLPLMTQPKVQYSGDRSGEGGREGGSVEISRAEEEEEERGEGEGGGWATEEKALLAHARTGSSAADKQARLREREEEGEGDCFANTCARAAVANGRTGHGASNCGVDGGRSTPLIEITGAAQNVVLGRQGWDGSLLHVLLRHHHRHHTALPRHCHSRLALAPFLFL